MDVSSCSSVRCSFSISLLSESFFFSCAAIFSSSAVCWLRSWLRHFTISWLCINRYQHQTGNGPPDHQHRPHRTLERAVELVHNTSADHIVASAPRGKHERHRDQILYAGAGVAARKPDQIANALGEVAHDQRRQYGEQWEEHAAQEEIVRLQLGGIEEQRLQVVAQRDRHDREAGRQCKHRKQGEEVLHGFQQPVGLVRTRHKVQRVQVLDVGERKDPGEGERQVEPTDQHVVEGNQRL
uniref:Uncharacterized protein n=1 Tax=Anopheles coluzzii TaxID=1518534 RepID=A0A8W7Q385_ANOCL